MIGELFIAIWIVITIIIIIVHLIVNMPRKKEEKPKTST
jgi:hypothetical protein